MPESFSTPGLRPPSCSLIKPPSPAVVSDLGLSRRTCHPGSFCTRADSPWLWEGAGKASHGGCETLTLRVSCEARRHRALGTGVPAPLLHVRLGMCACACTCVSALCVWTHM